MKKTLLGKLFAEENVHVRQDNVETAYFNLKSRELVIPFWENMTDEVYHLLLAHEAAHALWTPLEAVEKIQEQKIPHTVWNIVEDIRIENLMLKKFPGLLRDFVNGGHTIFIENDLFELKNQPLETRSFLDRINIAAKARENLDVPFFDEELEFIEAHRLFDLEEEKDVLPTCKALMDFIKQQKKKEPQPQNFEENQTPQAGNKQSQEKESNGNEQEMPTGSGSSKDSEKEPQDDKASQNDKQNQAESNTDENAPENSNSGRDENQDYGLDDPDFGSDTVDAMEQASKKFKSGSKVLTLPNQKDTLKILTPLDEVTKVRKSAGTKRFDISVEKENFAAWKKSVKGMVDNMARDFELQKAATRYSKAQEGSTGKLDPLKLHAYKTTDQIFKKSLRLQDAKSHGLIVMVDYSGSMHGPQIEAAMDNMMILAMFARKVRIPFTAIGFTSSSQKTYKRVKNALKHLPDNVFCFLGLNVFETMNASGSNLEFEENLFYAFLSKQAFSRGSGLSSIESLGSTPLDEAALFMKFFVRDFKAKHKTENLITIVLHDGDSDCASYVLDDNHSKTPYNEPFDKVLIDNELVKIDMNDSKNGLKHKIWESVVKEGVRLMNVYIENVSTADMIKTFGEVKGIEEYRKNKVFSVDAKIRKGFHRMYGKGIFASGLFEKTVFVRPSVLMQTDDGTEIKKVTATQIAKSLSSPEKRARKLLGKLFIDTIK